MRHSIQIGLLLVLAAIGSRSVRSEEPPTTAPYDEHVSRRPSKDAEPTAEEAEAIAKIERLLHRLAEDERKRQDYDSQIAQMRKRLETHNVKADPQNRERIATMSQLTDLLVAVEQLDEARQLTEETITLTQESLAPDHWRIQEARARLATIEKLSVATDDQKQQFRQARELLHVGEEFLTKKWFQPALACAMTAGKYRKELLGDSPETAECLELIGRIYLEAGKYLTGGIHLSGSAIMRRKTLGKEHPASVRSDQLVQKAKTAMKEHPEYVRELRERAVCELFGLDYEEMAPEFEEMRKLDEK